MVSTKEKNSHGRILAAVSPMSYRMFAKRYGIRLMNRIKKGEYEYRTSAQLKKDIYSYEKKYRPSDGMYF
jgi:hypothetical protein